MIYAASGNPLIAETANHHWRHIRRAMGAVLQIVGVRRAVWDEHTAIVQAINDGDADLAEQLARQHCERAGEHIAAQLTQHVRTLPECLAWADGASMSALSAQAAARAPAVSHGERLPSTAQCE
jgi:hypothetical protein